MEKASDARSLWDEPRHDEPLAGTKSKLSSQLQKLWPADGACALNAGLALRTGLLASVVVTGSFLAASASGGFSPGKRVVGEENLAHAAIPTEQVIKRESKARETVHLPSERLIFGGLGSSSSFHLALDSEPPELCEKIAIGPLATGWLPSAVFPGEWECAATVDVVTTPAKEGDGSSAAGGYRLFAMARGQSEGAVSYVRFKLSATDEKNAEQGASDLDDRVRSLFGSLRWDLPEGLSDTLQKLRPVSDSVRGMKIDFFQEKIADNRYNLVIELPKSQLSSPHLQDDFIARRKI
ncbi:DUF6030 family protein [Jiella avicenniae]|uniref:DUF6030 family protein n=1 Tax=Jiella avicenniae TaxID=2907202 RepID=A0A9X1P5W2_9HYPH|nr:DUF6030 family protein [Jiella avicenniae]MCE7030860.1 DUF6030 family protein [Jiella avicenniae]